jgi:spore coat protein U-like protein
MKKLTVLGMVLGLVLFSSGAVLAADTTTVAVSANVVGTCKFLTPGTMAFGSLDPNSGADVNATASPTFWCTKGASYTIADDDGLHKSGTTHRMQHATTLTEFIPYTFTYASAGTGQGRTTPITLTINGTVAYADYQNSASGDYADTVTLTITP